VNHFVVIGAGPVGGATARELIAKGHRVEIVTRSGHSIEGATARRSDASDPQALAEIATGATAIVNCANPPYTKWATTWPPLANSILIAAEKSGAALITMSNLYAHGPSHQTMNAQTPLSSTGTKGRIRARMWEDALAAHTSGRIRAAEVRSSDFFGPEVTDANMGARVVPNILQGKRVSLLGRTDVPHSFSYMPDVGRVVAHVASDESLWGRPWLVPSATMTQAQLVGALSNAAGAKTPKIGTMPSAVLRLAGLVVPIMRELREVEYQFAAPFVVDATETEKLLGIHATPIKESAAATISWWQSKSNEPKIK
jgi:nucleoside-diphosphate-sugar epimerase